VAKAAAVVISRKRLVMSVLPGFERRSTGIDHRCASIDVPF